MVEPTPAAPANGSITTSSTHSSSTSEVHSGKTLITLDFLALQHLVKLIESIFQNVAAASKGTDQSANLNDIIGSPATSEGMSQALNDIRCISCEMSCNLSAGKGSTADQTKEEMLRRLQKYSWNAQVVLAIAAFASSIGELSMLLKNGDTDPTAKSVNILKGNSSKLDLNVLEDQELFKAMIDVVKTNLAFLEPTIPKEAPTTKDATNKILQSVSQIVTILSQRKDIIDAASVRSLAQEIKDINTDLEKTLHHCKPAVVGETTPDQYVAQDAKPIRTISTSEVIQKIKNYIQEPEKLTNSHVLFLISDLDISIKEIKVLNGLYEKNGQKYEILWLPMVDLSANDANASRFLDLKQSMKWSVVEPSKIEAEVIEYIKKDWQFLKQPIAVSVNRNGKVTCQNALPMLWTWGNSAFPFTDEKEQDIWNNKDEQNAWRLELLLDGLELWLDDKRISDIRSWRESGTIVCLFGGGDISWIQGFKEKVKYAAHAAGVTLKLVYLGQNKDKILTKNVLGRDIHVLKPEFQWQFWSRLESILYAKIRRGKTVTTYAKTDQVMQVALKAVGYGGKGEAWATFSMGPGSMVTTSGEMALNIMANYPNWPQDKTGIRFLEGFKTYKDLMSRQVHGCINVHLPVLGQIPGVMICPECSKVMEMFYTYRCCPELLANTPSPCMF